MRKKQKNIAKLSIPVDGDTLPNELRLFVAGENVTTKGTFIFDEKAAAAVMAAYEAHGVDVMIDLEHLSLESGENFDPDARAWARLELRDGDLYAVDVRWTPDGARRLTEKTQRYVSPAFEVDRDGRITKIINVALVALPATHQTPALVAATARGEKDMQDPSTSVPGAVDGDAEKKLRAIAEIVDVEPTDAKKILEAVFALAGEEPPVEESEEEFAPATEIATARRRLLRLTSTKTLSACVAEVEALARERQQLTASLSAYETAERVRLCQQLVLTGARTPAQVWQQEAYAPGATPVPKAFLSRMTLPELRAYVAEEVAAVPPGKRPVLRLNELTPPALDGGVSSSGDREIATPHGVVTVSKWEIADCERFGAKLDVYAAKKAKRLAERRG